MKRISKSQIRKNGRICCPHKRFYRKVPRLNVTLGGKHRLHDNPEVSMRLTNLSLRHAGKRPEWFDFEPLKLGSHTRQCKRIYWQIMMDHRAGHKRVIALTAEPGMGKTSVLAELHAMLDRSRQPVMTLAPVVANRTPFEMIRSILEQRLYISGTATFDAIKRHVVSAIESMVPGTDGKQIGECVLGLWRKKPVSQPVPNANRAPEMQTLAVEEPTHPSAQLPDTQNDGIQVSEVPEELSWALTRLFWADLVSNALVIMLDDVMHYDLASLELLARVYQSLPNLPLTIVITLPSQEQMPDCLKCLPVDFIALQRLSDEDLEQLTQHVIMQLSKSREKVIVPEDICRRIAQLSVGSPKHAIQLTLRHFNDLPRYAELLEHLKRTPVRRTVCDQLVVRFKECLESERLILRFASLLNAPFTVSAIECLYDSWPYSGMQIRLDCRDALRRICNKGFINKAKQQYHTNAVTYVFSLEYERMIIAESASPEIRDHVYRIAPQWYAMHNINQQFDEAIGDLWRRNGSTDEACHYYVRSAYRAYQHSQLPKARRLFKKLLLCMPEHSMARRIQYTLANADIVFRLGNIDEAFLLCRRASHYALQLSSYAQSARAYIQMASMLIEIGSIRHVRRYLSHARELLNREQDPQARYALHTTSVRYEIARFSFDRASKQLAMAHQAASQFSISPHEQRYLSFLDARMDVMTNHPAQALTQFLQMADASDASGDIQMESLCLCEAGQIYLKIGDITEALDAWNKALGLAQEMNDIILHASLLADIADSALVLEANRTARSASEQCMHMSQQTHQKALIAKCMGHTACLQLAAEQQDKALRSLQRAHKSAHALRNHSVCIHTLMTRFNCYSKCKPSKRSIWAAERIFAHLCSYPKLPPLYMCELLALYANYHMNMHDFADARKAFQKLQDLLHGLGFEDACDKIQIYLDRLDLA